MLSDEVPIPDGDAPLDLLLPRQSLDAEEGDNEASEDACEGHLASSHNNGHCPHHPQYEAHSRIE